MELMMDGNCSPTSSAPHKSPFGNKEAIHTLRLPSALLGSAPLSIRGSKEAFAMHNIRPPSATPLNISLASSAKQLQLHLDDPNEEAQIKARLSAELAVDPTDQTPLLDALRHLAATRDSSSGQSSMVNTPTTPPTGIDAALMVTLPARFSAGSSGGHSPPPQAAADQVAPSSLSPRHSTTSFTSDTITRQHSAHSAASRLGSSIPAAAQHSMRQLQELLSDGVPREQLKRELPKLLAVIAQQLQASGSHAALTQLQDIMSMLKVDASPKAVPRKGAAAAAAAAAAVVSKGAQRGVRWVEDSSEAEPESPRQANRDRPLSFYSPLKTVRSVKRVHSPGMRSMADLSSPRRPSTAPAAAARTRSVHWVALHKSLAAGSHSPLKTAQSLSTPSSTVGLDASPCKRAKSVRRVNHGASKHTARSTPDRGTLRQVQRSSDSASSPIYSPLKSAPSARRVMGQAEGGDTTNRPAPARSRFGNAASAWEMRPNELDELRAEFGDQFSDGEEGHMGATGRGLPTHRSAGSSMSPRSSWDETSPVWRAASSAAPHSTRSLMFAFNQAAGLDSDEEDAQGAKGSLSTPTMSGDGLGAPLASTMYTVGASGSLNGSPEGSEAGTPIDVSPPQSPTASAPGPAGRLHPMAGAPMTEEVVGTQQQLPGTFLPEAAAEIAGEQLVASQSAGGTEEASAATRGGAPPLGWAGGARPDRSSLPGTAVVLPEIGPEPPSLQAWRGQPRNEAPGPAAGRSPACSPVRNLQADFNDATVEGPGGAGSPSKSYLVAKRSLGSQASADYLTSHFSGSGPQWPLTDWGLPEVVQQVAAGALGTTTSPGRVLQLGTSAGAPAVKQVDAMRAQILNLSRLMGTLCSTSTSSGSDGASLSARTSSTLPQSSLSADALGLLQQMQHDMVRMRQAQEQQSQALQHISMQLQLVSQQQQLFQLQQLVQQPAVGIPVNSTPATVAAVEASSAHAGLHSKADMVAMHAASPVIVGVAHAHGRGQACVQDCSGAGCSYAVGGSAGGNGSPLRCPAVATAPLAGVAVEGVTPLPTPGPNTPLSDEPSFSISKDADPGLGPALGTAAAAEEPPVSSTTPTAVPQGWQRVGFAREPTGVAYQAMKQVMCSVGGPFKGIEEDLATTAAAGELLAVAHDVPQQLSLATPEQLREQQMASAAQPAHGLPLGEAPAMLGGAMPACEFSNWAETAMEGTKPAARRLEFGGSSNSSPTHFTDRRPAPLELQGPQQQGGVVVGAVPVQQLLSSSPTKMDVIHVPLSPIRTQVTAVARQVSPLHTGWFSPVRRPYAPPLSPSRGLAGVSWVHTSQPKPPAPELNAMVAMVTASLFGNDEDDEDEDAGM